MQPRRRPDIQKPKDPFRALKLYGVLILLGAVWAMYRYANTESLPSDFRPRITKFARIPRPPAPGVIPQPPPSPPSLAFHDTWTPTGGLVRNMSSPAITDRMGLHFDVCGAMQRTGRYWAPPYLMRGLVGKGQMTVLLPQRFGFCLVDGQSPLFSYVYFDPIAFLPYGHLGDQTVTVVSNRPFPSMNALANDPRVQEEFSHVNFEGLYRKAATAYGPYNMRSALSLVTLSVGKANDWQEAPAGIPRVSPYAEAITKNQLMTLKGQGAVLLDLRAEIFFKQETIPGAQSLYLNNEPMALTVRAPNNFQRLPLPRAEIEKFEKDKPVVLFAQGPASNAPYNLAMFMALRGFERVYYFPGGMDEWRGKDDQATPTSVSGITVVDAAGALEAIRDRKAIVADVRNGGLVQKRVLPAKKVILVSVWENLSKRGHSISRSKNINADLVRKAGDRVIVEGQPIARNSGPVVVVGVNEYDWKALKAAVVLAAEGRTVLWFRLGMREWEVQHRIAPKKFRVPEPTERMKSWARKTGAKRAISPEQLLLMNPSKAKGDPAPAAKPATTPAPATKLTP